MSGRKIIYAVSLTGLLAGGAPAKNERSHFLSRGPGVAAFAQGEAYVSRSEDASSIFYNPAALAKQKGEIHAQYLPLTEGARYNFLGFTIPAGNIGTFGLGVIQLHRGGIEKRLKLGDEPTEVTATQTAFFLPYARDFKTIQLGLALKYVKYGLAGTSGSGFGVDLGGQKHIPLKKLSFLHSPQISFGVSIKNLIQPSLKLLSETKESLPMDFTFGMNLSGYLLGSFSEAAKAIIRDKLTLSIDSFLTPKQSLRVGVGLEYAIRQFLFLRGGYARGQIASGFGLLLGGQAQTFELDYAFSLASVANQHRFSVNYRFGRDKRYTTEAPKKTKLYSTIKEARDLKDRHMRLARQALREKKYEEARTNYDKAFILDPADGSTERSLRQVAEAILKQSIARFEGDIADAREKKDNARLLRGLVMLAEVEPKYPALAKDIRAIEANFPHVSEEAVKRISQKARANIQAEDFEEAEKCLRSLRVVSPEAPAIWTLTEELTKAKEQQKQAPGSVWKPAENGNKLYLRQLYAAAAISYVRENYPAAEASARQLLSMDPGNKGAKLLLRHINKNETKEETKE